ATEEFISLGRALIKYNGTAEEVMLCYFDVIARRTLVRRGNAAIKARAEYDFHTLPSRSSEKPSKAD
ncbi:MAG: hypothetical protein IKC66_04095, partial [Alistipes sp.]|nr:hypothetical protein [Alistipes sp.]